MIFSHVSTYRGLVIVEGCMTSTEQPKEQSVPMCNLAAHQSHVDIPAKSSVPILCNSNNSGSLKESRWGGYVLKQKLRMI